MNKVCAAFFSIMFVWCSMVFAQAGDHFAEGTISSIEDGVIVVAVADGENQSINLITQDFTSYEINEQQVSLADLTVGMTVRVAYYDYPDRGKELTHLFVLEQ